MQSYCLFDVCLRRRLSVKLLYVWRLPVRCFLKVRDWLVIPDFSGRGTVHCRKLYDEVLPLIELNPLSGMTRDFFILEAACLYVSSYAARKEIL